LIGKLLFLAMVFIVSHSACRFSSVSGRDNILLI
jgi:hypothetical protein